MWFVTLSVLLIVTIPSSTSNYSQEYSYGIAMTTIPLRFSSIHHTILSWFNQEIPPKIIVISLPSKYRRFKRKKHLNKHESNSDALRRYLSKTEAKSFLDKSNIVIVDLDKDYGPATKLSGLLTFYNSTYVSVHGSEPDFWIIGDDDVRYSATTISRYQTALESKFPSPSVTSFLSIALTHFAPDVRIYVPFRDNFRTPVLHVQGVDTILFSSASLRNQQLSGKALSYQAFTKMLDYFHLQCSESFYQDDYLISLAIAFSDIKVLSIWDGDNVAKHVDGVSKSNSQMHMHKDVFMREEKTKDCVRTVAVSALKLVDVDSRRYEPSNDGL